MKRFTLITLAAQLLLVTTLFAADKYTEAMQKNIETVYKAQTLEELQSQANTFHRIAETEKNKWEPFYYEAFAYVMMATREKDGAKKDSYLDAGLVALESAKALAPAESEIVAMEGFVHMMRVTVDPASRGQKYSGLAFQTFNKAVGMNPENPRALALLSQMELGTAQFFGSPITDACNTAAKALEKFDAFKSENPLAPTWGRSMAESLKTKCN